MRVVAPLYGLLAKKPEFRSPMMASSGCPVTMRAPRQGALSAKSNARLNPTTLATPATSNDVRGLLRKTSAPEFTIKASPLTTRVTT